MQIQVNETGARTLKDVRPMVIDGQYVYVTVDSVASLHVCGRIVAERTAAEITCAADAQAWADEYRETETARAEYAEATYVDPAELADEMDEQVSDAVQACRDFAAELVQRADSLAAVTGPYHFRNSRGRMVTLPESDPRHPAARAVSYRRDAERLAAWTDADEQAYTDYVQGGLADTDGWYTPMKREHWKATVGA